MDYSFNDVLIAFSLTLFAGLATGIGSLIALKNKEISPKFLTYTLGFSAGVMIYVSFVEIFYTAKITLDKIYDPRMALTIVTFGFFVGVLVTALIDKVIPSEKNPHEYKEESDFEGKLSKKNLLRTGVFTAVALAVHNFPEGFATFASSLQNAKLGISIAVAVAIHNIPEGIAVSVPVYYATKDKMKAFKLSFLSGLAEPLGAIVGFLLLRNFLTDTVFSFIFASVAGIMVYISLDELLPTAEKYGEHHISIYGVVSGMVVMALSLIII